MKSRPGKAPLVLIVEDDPEMLELLSRVVGSAGFRVETATDGLEVVKKMKALKPDVAVLDLMLPKYGGMEMLYELRRKETVDIPLIISTARFTRPTDRAAIMKQPNVAAFFEKPLDTDLLLNALCEVLGVERTPGVERPPRS